MRIVPETGQEQRGTQGVKIGKRKTTERNDGNVFQTRCKRTRYHDDGNGGVQHVKQGGEAAGVDGMTWEYLHTHRSRLLYQLWVRLASGSYFPKAIKAVSIPKRDRQAKECWACPRYWTG